MAQGRRTATGKNIWSKGEVQRILKNEKYVGDEYLAVGMLVNLICYYANEFVATHLDRFD